MLISDKRRPTSWEIRPAGRGKNKKGCAGGATYSLRPFASLTSRYAATGLAAQTLRLNSLRSLSVDQWRMVAIELLITESGSAAPC